MTARFVAEYSIQLSYECRWYLLTRLPLVEAEDADITENNFLNGALDRIRTCDRSVRSRVLYPAELRVHLLPRIIGRRILL